MPTVSMFFGIVVRMYFGPKEHNPPHVHVSYQGQNASFQISDGSLLVGEFPRRQAKLVDAWIEIHRDELMANWDLCQAGNDPFPVDPLDRLMYCDVKAVEPRDDYRLVISFADGSRKLFDMKPYLHLNMFRDLQNVSMFNSVRVAFGTVEWANHADFDPEALYDLGLPLKD